MISLDQMVAHRERQNIDILLLDEAHRIAVIIEHRPGDTEQHKAILQDLIRSRDGLIEDDHTRARIWFVPADWDVPFLRQAVSWIPSNRILLFEFLISPKSLSLTLMLGPGDAELRQALIQAARQASPPFKLGPNPGPAGTGFFSTFVLTEKEMSRAMIASLRLPAI